jgi:hypothetical protein
MALLCVLVVGYLDYSTGYELSFSLFYAGPILFSVWFLDRKATAIIVLFCAIVWWLADRMAGHVYSANWVHIWNTSVHLFRGRRHRHQESA